MNSYSSSCNGELVVAERKTALFPQDALEDRLRARDAFVLQKPEENSRGDRPKLSKWEGLQSWVLRYGFPPDPVVAERD